MVFSTSVRKGLTFDNRPAIASSQLFSINSLRNGSSLSERNIEQRGFKAYFIGCCVELYGIAEMSSDFPQIAGSMVDETCGNRHHFPANKLPAQSQKCERQAFHLVAIQMAGHAGVGKPDAANPAFLDPDGERLIAKPSVALQPLKRVAKPVGRGRDVVEHAHFARIEISGQSKANPIVCNGMRHELEELDLPHHRNAVAVRQSGSGEACLPQQRAGVDASTLEMSDRQPAGQARCSWRGDQPRSPDPSARSLASTVADLLSISNYRVWRLGASFRHHRARSAMINQACVLPRNLGGVPIALEARRGLRIRYNSRRLSNFSKPPAYLTSTN